VRAARGGGRAASSAADAQDAVGALDAQQVLYVVEDDDAVLSGAAMELGGQLEDLHQYTFGLGARVGPAGGAEAARSERDAEARAGWSPSPARSGTILLHSA
jgi:hypothetical protein